MVESMILIGGICVYVAVTFGIPVMFCESEKLFQIAWILGMVLFVIVLLAIYKMAGEVASIIPDSVYEQLIQ